MAEEKVVNLKINDNIDEATSSVKSLKAQLREAQNEVTQLSDKFGATSKQAIDAAKKAAQLKDAIGDAKALTDAFNPDAKFKSLSASLTGVAGGFSAVTGAMGLLGAESKEVEQAILRVQSAMALASGLQAVGESVDSFKQLGAVAKQALAGIRTGIAATGIGVLLVALGAVVAYWDDIKEAVSGVSAEQKELNTLSQASFETKTKELETVGKQDNILKLQGKTEKEILAIKIKQTDEAITAGKVAILNQENANKSAKAAAQQNNEYLKTFTRYAVEASLLPLRILAAPIDLLLSAANKVSSVLGLGKITAINVNDEISKLANLGADKVAKFVFDPAKVEAEGNAVIAKQKETLLKLQNDRAGYVLQGQAIDKAEADKAAAKAKEEADKAAKPREESFKAGLKLEEENYAYEAAKNKRIEDQRAAHLNNLVNANLNASKQQIENEREASEAKQRITEEEYSLKISQAQEAAKALGQLSELAGKDTLAGKALGIASATVNTYVGVTEALKQKSTLPSPFDVVAKVANVATVLATGFKAVKAITAVKVPGGGGGGGASSPISVSGASAPSAPQFNVVGASGVNQLAQTLNRDQPPVKAYVVSNDVTTAQSLDRNIVKSASLG